MLGALVTLINIHSISQAFEVIKRNFGVTIKRSKLRGWDSQGPRKEPVCKGDAAHSACTNDQPNQEPIEDMTPIEAPEEITNGVHVNDRLPFFWVQPFV